MFDSCDLNEDWASTQNFVLVDVKLGQSVLVGSGAPSVVADLALPTMSDKSAEDASAKSKRRDPEYVVQGQRLTRWIRRLPVHHDGFIAVAPDPLPQLYTRLIEKGRRYPQTVPACIAHASFSNSFKYRVTPGTTWCGDGGWTSSEYFMILRTNSSVPEKKRVPICIGYNSQFHTYRYENDATDCVGTHSQSGTNWIHHGTMHTSVDATGEYVCVGRADDGARTRWMMKKAEKCDTSGFKHQFNFRAMQPKLTSNLVSTCIWVAKSQKGSHTLRRMSMSDKSGCDKAPHKIPDYEEWRNVMEPALLARRLSKSDYRICAATASVDLLSAGAPDGEVGDEPVKGWRLLKGEPCEEKTYKSVEKTSEGDLSVTWTVETPQNPTPVRMYSTAEAAGKQICVCRMSSGRPAKEVLQYTLADKECVAPRRDKEFCFHDLSGEDIVQASYLLDEPV
jgi:hypothetical protein